MLGLPRDETGREGVTLPEAAKQHIQNLHAEIRNHYFFAECLWKQHSLDYAAIKC